MRHPSCQPCGSSRATLLQISAHHPYTCTAYYPLATLAYSYYIMYYYYISLSFSNQPPCD